MNRKVALHICCITFLMCSSKMLARKKPTKEEMRKAVARVVTYCKCCGKPLGQCMCCKHKHKKTK